MTTLDLKSICMTHVLPTKMVSGKQLTVCWHVDDLKVSNVEQEVIDEFFRRNTEHMVK